MTPQPNIKIPPYRRLKGTPAGVHRHRFALGMVALGLGIGLALTPFMGHLPKKLDIFSDEPKLVPSIQILTSESIKRRTEFEEQQMELVSSQGP